MAQEHLGAQQLALIADCARVWEVRRFCQVLPSVVKYERGNETACGGQSVGEPNGALAALLRCVIYQLGADLAMISLLDDHTQYFVSGASRSNVHDAKVTLESTRWYGCESVLHHGGLCERTIAQRNYPGALAFYEELDMADTERTKDLPFVRGDIARFRHYAGVPLNPHGGPNVGTVFMFSETPSTADLSDGIRSYLTQTASHVTRHLEQAVEALEGQRALRFNRGISSLLSMSHNVDTGVGTQSSSVDAQRESQPLLSNRYPDDALRLYRLATNLLCDIFELDGARIQEVRAWEDRNISNPDWNGSGTMAETFQTDAPQPQVLSPSVLGRLLQLFPQGAVFQVAVESGKVIAATCATPAAMVVDAISRELTKAFFNAEQLVVMPLWDTHRERNIGAVLGFAYNRSRAYLGPSDLSSISAFCATVMTQVRRLEVQAMIQIKSDFLGSISHEMRTPLHGILSNLELLAETSYEEHQRDLLEMARYSGVSLLDSMDRLLNFSKISSTAQQEKELFSEKLRNRLSEEPSLSHDQRETSSTGEDHPSIVQVCEKLVQRAAQKLRLKRSVRPELVSSRRSGRCQHKCASSPPTAACGANTHPLIVFDTNVDWSCCLMAVTDFETVFTNLLDNALKFGDPAGSVRGHLKIENSSVSLTFSDTGRGITPDFFHHRIFEPFSQEDPLDEGTGLGLSLVKRAATALGGDVQIESHESWGSTFTVTFLLDRLMYCPIQKATVVNCSDLCSAVESPQLELSLFASGRWRTGDDVRDLRCTTMVSESLKEGASRWFQTKITPWEAPTMLPRLLFVFLEDLDLAVSASGDVLDHNKLVVLCPNIEDVLSPRITDLKNSTAIFGPVTISTLQDALARLFPGIVPPSEFHVPLDSPSRTANGHKDPTHVKESIKDSTNAGIDDSLPSLLADLELEITGQREPDPSTTMSLERSSQKSYEPLNLVRASNAEFSAQPGASSRGTPIESPDKARLEPRLLLVDDNSINLKVLSMFAQKATSTPLTSVSSGREALDAFSEALGNHPYDLVFLDLSMPEISGFEVARRIRVIEAEQLHAQKTNLCALTALVSADDQRRAYAAGVDEYVIKPAKLGDLKAVIENWRKRIKVSSAKSGLES